MCFKSFKRILMILREKRLSSGSTSSNTTPQRRLSARAVVFWPCCSPHKWISATNHRGNDDNIATRKKEKLNIDSTNKLKFPVTNPLSFLSVETWEFIHTLFRLLNIFSVVLLGEDNKQTAESDPHLGLSRECARRRYFKVYLFSMNKSRAKASRHLNILRLFSREKKKNL